MLLYSFGPSFIGLKAKAISALSPTGFIQLLDENGEILDARSRHEFIMKGKLVEIIGKDFSGAWIVKPL